MKIAEHDLDFASLRALIDSLPGLIHTGRPDGYLDFFNQRWLQFVGLRLEDLEGWKWMSAVHADDVAALIASWRACLASGEPLGFEARVRRADGEYRWMLHQKVAVRDEAGHIVKWYGSSVDIEDRKRAEFKIRAREAELQQILDFTPQHLGVFGPDGTPLRTNHVALEYFGIDVDQWRAKGSRLGLVHPDDREHFLGEREMRFLAGAPHEFAARLLRHDGKFRYFLFRLNPLKDERGQITRWFGTAIDIDDRKQVEDRLQRENVVLRDEIDQTSMFEEIVGSSDVLSLGIDKNQFKSG